ncbi:MAG: hypothetical protein ACYDDC_05165, partial [Thermoplasmataceae archaeon]
DFYIANSDFVSYFLNGCTYQGNAETDYVIKRELYQAYLKAARMRNAVTLGDQSFKANVLQKCKWNLGDKRHEINGKQEHTFDGIRLKPEKYWFTETDPSEFDAEPNTPQKGGNGGNPQSKLPGLPTSKGVFADGKDEGKNQDNPTKSDVQNEKQISSQKDRVSKFRCFVILKRFLDGG